MKTLIEPAHPCLPVRTQPCAFRIRGEPHASGYGG
jgi:hypothetical protein